MIALVGVIAAIVGLVVYLISSNSKAAELGRILFGCAVLVVLLRFSGDVVKVLGR